MEIDPIIKQAIEIGIKLGIEAYKNERNANLKNKKILICRSDAERRFGRGVIRNLEKRKLVFPYQFGRQITLEIILIFQYVSHMQLSKVRLKMTGLLDNKKGSP